MSQPETPQLRLIIRLSTIYGEPKTNDPALYLAEFEKAIQGWSADIIEQAGDEVIRKCTFWPRPAEIIERCEAIAFAKQARKPKVTPVEDLPPPTEEQRQLAREIVAQAVAFMTADDDSRSKLPPVDRRAFEAMQRASRNHFHRVLTPISRRMTGEGE